MHIQGYAWRGASLLFDTSTLSLSTFTTTLKIQKLEAGYFLLFNDNTMCGKASLKVVTYVTVYFISHLSVKVKSKSDQKF